MASDQCAPWRSLADPDLYADGPPHARFAQLRTATPVVWQEMEGQTGFFAVLGHADVVAVSRDPATFSAARGGIVLDDVTQERLELSRDALVVMDPPRHTEFRQPLAPYFKRNVMRGLEAQIRSVCRDIFVEVRSQGPVVEFVHDVSARLPTRVMGNLFGLPPDDWTYVHQLSERMLAAEDPEIAPDEGSGNAMAEMAAYARDVASQRRGKPRHEDLTTVLLESEFGGQQVTDGLFGGLFTQIVAAGNDTTKTLTSSGLLALLEHPNQLAEVRADPALLPGAVEEMLRWANPIHYMRRTATRDTVLHGVPVAEGQKVALYYTSANRDPEVFFDPDRFDIHRNPNHHLSFGIGEHFCLGVHLARLEAQVLFDELFSAFSTIELAGEPVRLRSNFNSAYKRLPIRLGTT